MATTASVNALQTNLQTLRSYDLSKVVRKGLGTGAFESAEKIVDLISKIAERITPHIYEIDDISINELNEKILDIVSLFNQIATYDDGRFLNQRQIYSPNLMNIRENVVNVWSKIVGLIHEIEKSTLSEDFEQQLSSIKAETLNEAEEIKNLRSRLTHEIEDFEKRYSSTFQKAEINEQASVFNKQAEKFLENSKLWIGGISICAAVLIIVIICIFKNFCFEMSCFDKISQVNYNTVCDDCNRPILYLEIFKAIFFRLFIISFVVYLLNFCIKNYNASMHNYTINRHKANSLDASIRLLERLYSEKAKDEVLTNAANAIFSHQPTGYSNKDPENLPHSVVEKVIEKIDPTKSTEN